MTWVLGRLVARETRRSRRRFSMSSQVEAFVLRTSSVLPPCARPREHRFSLDGCLRKPASMIGSGAEIPAQSESITLKATQRTMGCSRKMSMTVLLLENGIWVQAMRHGPRSHTGSFMRREGEAY